MAPEGVGVGGEAVKGMWWEEHPGKYRRYLRRKLVFYAGHHDASLRTGERLGATLECAELEGVSIPRSLRPLWKQCCTSDPFWAGSRS